VNRRVVRETNNFGFKFMAPGLLLVAITLIVRDAASFAVARTAGIF
jgi:hypothetical protein